MSSQIVTWENTCDMYEQMLYAICDADKKEIDRIFLIDLDRNLKFIHDADPFEISTGTGGGLAQLQKIDAIVGKMRHNPESAITDEALEIMGTYDGLQSLQEEPEKRSFISDSMSKDEMMAFRNSRNSRNSVNAETLNCEFKAEGFYCGGHISASKMGREESADGVVIVEERIKNFFGINGRLEDCEPVKKAVKKARKKLCEYLCGDSDKNPEQPVEDFINAVMEDYNSNLYQDQPAKKTTNLCKFFLPTAYKMDISHVTWPFLFYTGISKWRIGFMDDCDKSSERAAAIRKAVDRVLYAHIMYALIDRFFEVQLGGKRPKTEIRSVQSIKERHDIGFLYKSVSSLDYSRILSECFFASAMELEREEKKKTLLKELMSGYVDDPKKIVEEKRKAQKKLEEKEEEINRLKEELEAEKEKTRQAGRTKFNEKSAEASIQSLNRSNLALERQLKEKDEEIAMLREQLEASAATIEEDTIQVSMLPQGSEERAEADTDARYLFMCSHEVCARRLKEAFPNSFTTEDYTLVPSNAQSFKAVVCVTPSISHVLYHRIKNICRNADVPFINCNTINVDTVKRLLSEQGFVREHQKCS